MHILDFINNAELRKTLEESLEYISALYEMSKAVEENKLVHEETCRVIILYAVSSIEAVLLYIYKNGTVKMERTEYKCASQIYQDYSNKNKVGLPVVVAVQERIEKKDYEIGLSDLVNFFADRGLMSTKLTASILEINDPRNTFHFSKPRDKSCNLARVEEALNLFVQVLEHPPKTAIKD